MQGAGDISAFTAAQELATTLIRELSYAKTAAAAAASPARKAGIASPYFPAIEIRGKACEVTGTGRAVYGLEKTLTRTQGVAFLAQTTATRADFVICKRAPSEKDALAITAAAIGPEGTGKSLAAIAAPATSRGVAAAIRLGEGGIQQAAVKPTITANFLSHSQGPV